MEVLRVEQRRRTSRGRARLNQYLESQEDHEMIRLTPHFTKTQKGRRESVSVCLLEWKRGGLYSSGGENMLEGHLMTVGK